MKSKAWAEYQKALEYYRYHCKLSAEKGISTPGTEIEDYYRAALARWKYSKDYTRVNRLTGEIQN